jgi:hypothetical protein
MAIKTVIIPVTMDAERKCGFISHENADGLTSELSHEEVIFYYTENDIIGRIVFIKDSNLALVSYEGCAEIIPADDLRKDLKKIVKAGTHIILEKKLVSHKKTLFAYCELDGANLSVGYISPDNEASRDYGNEALVFEYNLGKEKGSLKLHFSFKPKLSS